VPVLAEVFEEAEAAAEAPSAAEAPTDAVTMVPVTMEAGALSPLHGPASNGAAVAVAVPAPEAEPEAERARRIARPVELPRARRPSAATIAALAAVAGLLALALGIFAFLAALDRDGPSAAAAARDSGRALGLLSKPSTERVPLAGSQGALVLAVGSGGRAVLVLRGLEPAPSGKTYEAWVLDPAGGARDPAGLFSGGERIVELTRPVPVGASVAVTVEDAVGSDTPTQRLSLVARRG
jgi:anti-sigma-K factor RskA